MNNFKKGGFRQGGDNSGGRPKFGGRFGGGGSGDRNRRSPELFQAICAECRKQCQVPFRPSQNKPVYCRDCFGKQRHVPGRNSNGADGPRPDSRRDFVPERQEQSQYASPQNNVGFDALARQISTLDSKINRILEIVIKKQETLAPISQVLKVAPHLEKTTKTNTRKIVKKGKK